MNDKDLQIENILEAKKPKEKVDGKAKGNRTELHLCKLLTEHFGEDFTRSVGSGNRFSQVSLPEHAKQVFSGDLCCPKDFIFVLEAKGGYLDLDLSNVCDEGGVSRLDKFIEQSKKDAEFCGRKSLICWKRNRKPWLAVIESKELESLSAFHCRIHYHEWTIVSLDELLKKTERSFWFK